MLQSFDFGHELNVGHKIRARNFTMRVEESVPKFMNTANLSSIELMEFIFAQFSTHNLSQFDSNERRILVFAYANSNTYSVTKEFQVSFVRALKMRESFEVSGSTIIDATF